MFAVSYINNINNEIGFKGNLSSTKEAREWIEKQGDKITPLKLLVWDEDIQCHSVFRDL